MSLWILDTDHASLFNVQELFNGWVGRLNNPAQAQKITQLYTKLWETTEFMSQVRNLGALKNVGCVTLSTTLKRSQ